MLHIRILLIVSLAASTPAWCCCAVRAAAVSDGEMPECCVAKPQAGAAAKDCGGDCDPCRCANREVEQQRLDTAPRLASVRLPVHELAVLVPEFAALIGPGAAACATPCDLWGHDPPPWSLLDQGCLLLL